MRRSSPSSPNRFVRAGYCNRSSPGRMPCGAAMRSSRANGAGAQRAALHTVPVIVRNLSDQEAAEFALIENVQRTDLNPIEEANGYHELMDKFGYTQEVLAELVGKSRSHLANTVRLLKLPAGV